MGLLFAALWVGGRQSGLLERIDIDSVRAWVEGAGAWGVVLFVAAFAAGELLHVPGMIFVAAGILAWGKVAGFGVALVAAVISISVSFVVVRRIGGTAFAGIDRPIVKRLLARLESRPISTVFVLRVFLWLAPALNYALALTTIRFRDYLVGSALGLVPPILAVTLLFEWVLSLIRA